MIYIDNINLTFRGKKYCHMVSDKSIDELMEFALKIGLKKEWFQDKSTPHFDVAPSIKRKALSIGAKELDLHENWDKMQEIIDFYRSKK
jgi:hypothetical protein